MTEDYYDPVFGKEPSMKEKVDSIFSKLSTLDEKQIKKLKKLKVPRRAKVSKSRRKKGYVGVLFVSPNKVIKGEKVKLEGGTYDTKDGNYHYTDGHEIVWWEGKYPLLWQRYDKTNPTNLIPKEGDKNEIYGQDQIKLRMKSDVIKDKGKGGGMSIIIIIAVLVGGYFLVKLLFPKLFGG
jgi:hypothetical protein